MAQSSLSWDRKSVVPGRVEFVDNSGDFNSHFNSVGLLLQNRPPLLPPRNMKAKQKHPAQPTVTPDIKFASFQASVSDAWQTDDENPLINANAAQNAASTVLQLHRNESTGGNHPNLSHNRGRTTVGMQLLAIQKNLSETSQHSSGGGQSQSSLYPKLPNLSGPVDHMSGTPVPKTLQLASSGRSCYQSSDPTDTARSSRLEQILNESTVDLEKLRAECWKGIPHKLRPSAWRILSSYMPTGSDRKDSVLARKRDEYWQVVEKYYHTRTEPEHADIFRQIHIDIPRMCPIIPLFQQKIVQEMFERILYIFAYRHPASSYVQGINDLVTPFFVVFLSEFIRDDSEVGSCEVDKMPKAILDVVEADSFWCVSRLLDTIQDNYTFAQPGVQTKIERLGLLMERVDRNLHQHLERNQVEYLQFAFRWMNNLLMRELPLRCTIRLWDTYLSEPNGFAVFHVYVCAAFLRIWSEKIRSQKDFQNVMLLLQNLPTGNWGDRQICELTADAYSLKCLFDGTKSHLTSTNHSGALQ